jgi:hypothetical protein
MNHPTTRVLNGNRVHWRNARSTVYSLSTSYVGVFAATKQPSIMQQVTTESPEEMKLTVIAKVLVES